MAATPVEFWFDPACPWCWVTSRWITGIAEERELEITWHAISLAQKNDTQPDSPFYEPVQWTKRLLRVIESVKAEQGADAVAAMYTRFGTLIHHEGNFDFDLAAELEGLGIDAKHLAAFDDDSIDDVLRAQMEDGLSLVGNDVGTPIIAVPGPDGGRVGLFGPVISKVPTGEDALGLWDGLLLMARTEGFWELKRTRTVGPDMSTVDPATLDQR